MYFFFFFQAEDGIRDIGVTGVQTCALPIFVNRRTARLFAAHYPAEYLGDTVESTVIALRAGCTVAQHPVQMRVRQGGRASQTPFRAALYLCRAVVALVLALVRDWPETPAPPALAEEPV